MDDEYGPDIDFSSLSAPPKPSGPHPQSNPAPARPKIQQPTPQALPSRSGPSAILVSTRQKGNPILNSIRALPWEYSDIPADYVLGATTCALFLSLKYHRLHPEYIYARIRSLGGKYNLRILLTMVDIQNHEEPLKELAKTSLVNNLTLILCWSAAEAGRYLETYKSFEHASPASIRAHQATSYSEKLVEFITVPRSVNKTDAVGLVSAFGSVRAAVNARPEEVAGIAGWGEKKVQRWCGTVREPFRVRKAARRGLGERGASRVELRREESLRVDDDLFVSEEPERVEKDTPMGSKSNSSTIQPTCAVQNPTPRLPKRPAEEASVWEPGEEEEEALLLAAMDQGGKALLRENTKSTTDIGRSKPTKPDSSTGEGITEGMMAALAKLRKE